MAPAFDHRSIVAYSPIMTEEALRLLADWDALPAGSEVDVAAAMMHATLHIISRTMFSSDSDEIVGIVESGVGRYQAEVRPVLADLLELPEWLSRLSGARRAKGIFSEFDRAIDRLLASRGRAGAAQPKDLLARLIAARDEETGGGMTAQGSARPGGHHLHGRARDHRGGADLDLVPALATPGRRSAAAGRAAGRARRDGSPKHEDLAKLPYTRMVIEEAMRFYPPAHTLSRQRWAPTRCWISTSPRARPS